MFFVCALCELSCSLEELSVLPCGHGIHRGCLADVAAHKKKCPKYSRTASRGTVIDKLYLVMEQPTGEDQAKESTVRAQLEVINSLLKKKKQYQAMTEQRCKELEGIQAKIGDVRRQLKATREDVKALSALEDEHALLKSEVASVEKENRRLKRLLQLDEGMSTSYGNRGDRKSLLTALNVLAKQCFELKRKREEVVKDRLRCTSRIALAKRESNLLQESMNESTNDSFKVPRKRRRGSPQMA